ncbi:MAG: carboxymuconolactone decarboxylase family protein [Planctomycetota bacterium]
MTQTQQLSDEAARSLERLQESFGVDSLPESFVAYGRSPVFLKDLMMNARKYVAGSGAIDQRHRTLIALATALHAKSEPWVELLTKYSQQVSLDKQELIDVNAVASTNYMYNTFFKFRHLSGTDRFDGMPVSLRAHTFTNVSLDEATCELINIAISNLNACEPCVSGHVTKAKQLGLTDQQLLEAIQCAATVYAGTQFLAFNTMLRAELDDES